MKPSSPWPLSSLLGVLLVSASLQAFHLPATAQELDDTPAKIVVRKVADFILSDLEGGKVALCDYSDRRALVLFFMGTGCPIANLYLTQLGELQRAYGKRGVQVIGIHSNAGVSLSELAEHAKKFKVSVPVLHDPLQRVADLLGAKRTAEVFLLDQRRVIRYHGRLDDRFGYTYKREVPRRRDLREAIDELLAGKKITVSETTPLGCLITRSEGARPSTTLTYAREISRIIERRCHECHRRGMIGPFPLLSYDDVVESSAMMKEVVIQRRMPPWHADPRYGHFSNNRKMPQEEVDILVSWIDAGMPLGDRGDLPPPKKYAQGWTIDEPDVVLELPEEVTVPADGVVPYLYLKVPTDFKEDVWIQAAEARPGNRSVVHHIIVFVRNPDDRTSRRGQGSLLVGTAPGDPPMELPPGVAKKISVGAELVFQMHYTPTGKVEKDRSSVGLIFYKGPLPPRGLARSKSVLNHRFVIPPGESNLRVESSYTFDQNSRLLSLMPHMHLRGKDFLYRATYPDGRSEILLSVPSYDFNWQNTYHFATPVRAPKGTRIDCVAHFDNSAGNPANPDPEATVRWGDQTWEEMMIGWITYMWDDSVGGAERF